MSFAYTYITLKLRELFRSKLYKGFMAFVLLLAFSAALLLPRVDTDSAYTLAVLNEHQTLFGDAVIATLGQDGGYRLRVCTDRRELEGAVLSGEAFCGYIFAEDADKRIKQGKYTALLDSFYREKSPAAALCNEAVCGAVYEYIAPLVAQQSLTLNGFATEQLPNADNNMAKSMKIVLLGADGQTAAGNNGQIITDFLYSVFCSLIVIFAIVTAFYTQSINKTLVFAGQKQTLVELCSFLSYSVSYLVILTAAHLVLGAFLPQLLADSRLLWKLLGTALLGGGLQLLSRRFLSPAVLPLLPFAAVLLVAAASI